MTIFSHYQERYQQALQEDYSLQEYLELCRDDPTVYATAAQRMLTLTLPIVLRMVYWLIDFPDAVFTVIPD